MHAQHFLTGHTDSEASDPEVKYNLLDLWPALNKSTPQTSEA